MRASQQMSPMSMIAAALVLLQAASLPSLVVSTTPLCPTRAGPEKMVYAAMPSPRFTWAECSAFANGGAGYPTEPINMSNPDHASVTLLCVLCVPPLCVHALRSVSPLPVTRHNTQAHAHVHTHTHTRARARTHVQTVGIVRHCLWRRICTASTYCAAKLHLPPVSLTSSAYSFVDGCHIECLDHDAFQFEGAENVTTVCVSLFTCTPPLPPPPNTPPPPTLRTGLDGWVPCLRLWLKGAQTYVDVIV
jgi:hypothetical protein